jgi:outer membrane lipoprotein SlyB
MFNRYLLPIGSLAMMALLVACGPQDDPQAEQSDAAEPEVAEPAEREVAERPAPAPAPVVCATCGVVRSITAVEQEGRGTGIGAVAGAVVGGVAGHQVGGGRGQDIATVAGAVGGAILGNKIEKDRNASTYYEITIDMEGGGQQFITVPDASGIAVGSRVTVQGGNISLR